jgi:hypothetical protein
VPRYYGSQVISNREGGMSLAVNADFMGSSFDLEGSLSFDVRAEPG